MLSGKLGVSLFRLKKRVRNFGMLWDSETHTQLRSVSHHTVQPYLFWIICVAVHPANLPQWETRSQYMSRLRYDSSES